MPLVAGDIAIVSLNHDTNKIFAFVCLVDIPAGEVIKFTDNGWTVAGAFRTGEGVITWTAPAGGITAGTVITINTTSTTPTVTGGGTATETGDVNFSTAGDQLLAYQGADGTPTFLYALNNEGANVWQTTADSSNTSALPTGLTDGTNAVALPELDNYRYSGPTTGTRAELLAAISNRANWTGDDAVNQNAPGSFTVNIGGSVSFAVSDATVTEGDSGTVFLTFTVTRSSGTGAATIDYATSDGTATAGLDYTASSGTLSFADGQTSRTVTVPVIGDVTVEANETLSLNLSNPSTGTISDAIGVGTITNDDVPAATFSVSDATVAEGNSGTAFLTFTVTRSSGTGAATIDYATSDGTATAGLDYIASSGTLSFADGQTSRTVTVPVNGDVTFEADETLSLTLSNPSAGTISDATGVGTITNDDAPASTVSVADASVTEGNAGSTSLTFTVTRSNGTGAATVDYATSDGTGVAGVDYTATSGTLSFADGVTSLTVTVPVLGDTDFEANETLTLSLSNASGTVIADGAATGTITNDDAAPVSFVPFINEFHYDNSGTDTGEFIEIAGTAGTVLTGYSLVLYNGNGNASYATIALSGTIPNLANGLGVLSFAGPGGGIQNGSPDGIALVDAGGNVLEFISYEGTMTAANGPAAGLTSVDVGVEEPGDASGTSIARVGNGGSPANFTWTLANDDTPGAVNNGQTFSPVVSVSNASVTEGNSGSSILTFTVTRSSGSGAASVDYATADGPAAGGLGANSTDYTPATGTIRFADGVTSQTVTVLVAGDIRPELDEVVLLNLSNPSAGLVISDGQGAGTITNDDGAPSTVTIGDVTIAEGQAGTSTATFTVTRAGGTGAFSVDFATGNGTATAGSDFIANSGTLNFASGVNTQTVTVTINGDIESEATETFNVNLTNATNDVVITDGQGIGTISNDDVTRIWQIQGESHTSTYDGQNVLTKGIVTAIDSNGFYMQDATGDGNNRTSDGIFVFTSTAPVGIVVGSAVEVQGVVQEDRFEPAQLSVTRIVLASGGLTVSGTGTITSTVIGTLAGQRAAPTENIDNDGLTSYDPDSDGIDFWESMEGMLVTLADAQAVSATASGGTYAISNSGTGSTGENSRGGITLGADGPDADSIADFNPERVLIFDDSTVSGSYTPAHTTGDRLGDVTGVVHYFGGEYEIVVSAPVNVIQDVTLTPETTDLVLGDTAGTGPADRLTVGSYNVENLDPGDGARITALGVDIAGNLGAPDVIGLVEVQDADGAGAGTNLSGQASAQALINAIVAAGGPTYLYVEVAPATANSTGGEPNGNIRNGFLYNPNRVDYVPGSATALQDAAFSGSRKPLSAQFNFNGETLTVLSIHSTSRIGSDPLFGSQQPPTNAGEAGRTAQSQAILSYLDALRAVDPDAHLIVSGDFNAFQFENSVSLLEAGANGLNNLYDLLTPEERYSYLFEGNSQALDHMLVSNSLVSGAQFDAVHINTGQSDGASDHDGLVALLTVVGAGNNQLVGTSGADTLAGLGGNDTYTVNNAGDVVVEGSNAGTDSVLSSVSYALTNNVENLTLTGTAANGTGNGLANTVTGNASVNTLDGGDGDDVLIGRGGDDRLLGGNGIDTASFALAAAGVHVQLNSGEVRNDGDGGVDVVSAVENVTGSSFADLIIGDAGSNVINGGLGSDTLLGLDGNDTLIGGTGVANEIYGGRGDDLYVVTLTGDTLIENTGEGTDTVQTDLGSLGLRANFENLTFTGSGDFGGTGNDLDNILTGASGRDRLDGSEGNDTLIGRGGIDSLIGGNGLDTADYSAALAGASVRLSVQLTLDDGDGSFDVLTSVENVTGSAFGDQLFGDAGSNVINGGLGSDILLGLDGNDTLIGGTGVANEIYGGLGDDLYILAAVGDTVIENLGEGTDTVQTSLGNHTLRANFENLIYTGSGDFSGTGNGLANAITGGAGSDTLTGGQGNDTLAGGLGTDTAVLSGIGNDYSIEALGGGSYRITDNVAGRDGIDTLSGIEFLQFGNGVTVVLGGGASAPLSTADKADGDALVQPGLIDDGFIDTKGADLPQVQPGLDHEMPWADAWLAPTGPYILVREGHALTLLDGLSPDDQGRASGSHHGDWHQA